MATIGWSCAISLGYNGYPISALVPSDSGGYMIPCMYACSSVSYKAVMADSTSEAGWDNIVREMLLPTDSQEFNEIFSQMNPLPAQQGWPSGIPVRDLLSSPPIDPRLLHPTEPDISPDDFFKEAQSAEVNGLEDWWVIQLSIKLLPLIIGKDVRVVSKTSRDERYTSGDEQ